MYVKRALASYVSIRQCSLIPSWLFGNLGRQQGGERCLKGCSGQDELMALSLVQKGATTKVGAGCISEQEISIP